MSSATGKWFEQWRRDRRESHQVDANDGDAAQMPSNTKDAMASVSSIEVGGATISSRPKTPQTVKAAPTQRMVPRIPTMSASKVSKLAHLGSARDPKKTAVATRDRSDEPDTDDSYSVRDQIVAEEPALWDPPFAPTPTPATIAKAKTPAKAPTKAAPTPRKNGKAAPSPPTRAAPKRGRAARRSSPILNAPSEEIDDGADKLENGIDEEGEKAEDVQVASSAGKKTGRGRRAAQNVAAASPSSPEKRYTIQAVIGHKKRDDEPNLFDMEVRWASKTHGPMTSWEPEETIHQDAPRALFAYWRRRFPNGGREEAMDDPNLWYVESVKKHRVARGLVELLVSWVGSPEYNWEPEGRVVDIAPSVVDDYWEEKGGRESCLGEGGKKRKTGGAPAKRGRPAKKARKSN